MNDQAEPEAADFASPLQEDSFALAAAPDNEPAQRPPAQAQPSASPPYVKIAAACLGAGLALFFALAALISSRAADLQKRHSADALRTVTSYAARVLDTRIELLMQRARARGALASAVPDTGHSLLRRLEATPDPLIDSLRLVEGASDALTLSLSRDNGASIATLSFPALDSHHPATRLAAKLTGDWLASALAGAPGSDALAFIAVAADGRVAGEAGAQSVVKALGIEDRLPIDLMGEADVERASGGVALRARAHLMIATQRLAPGVTLVAVERVPASFFTLGPRLAPFLIIAVVPAGFGLALFALLWLQGRKLAETAWRADASDRLVNLAVTSPGCGLWDWDVDGGRMFWSGPLLAMTGRPSRGTWLSLAESYQLLAREDIAKLDHWQADLAAGASAIHTQLRLQTLAGATVWCEAHLRAWEPGARRIIGMLLDITRPIEERRAAEATVKKVLKAVAAGDADVAAGIIDAKGSEQLEAATAALERSRLELLDLSQKYAAARARAEEANRTKSEFLANMSHELKTPLNAIIGFSEIMHSELYGAIGDERYRSYAADIYESGRQLAHLIDDILEMSKIEAGRIELEIEDLDIEGLTAECVRLIEPRARDAGVVVENRIAEAPIAIGDRRATKRILMNLLMNAIKFTQRGGLVTIEAQAEDGVLRITVDDNGIGIAEEDLERILAPFEQVEQHSQRTHRGTGLGLAMSKALAEMQNGALKLESTQGVGTRVSLALPLTRPQPETGRQSAL